LFSVQPHNQPIRFFEEELIQLNGVWLPE